MRGLFGGWKKGALGSKEEDDTAKERVVGVTVITVAGVSVEAGRPGVEEVIAGKAVGAIVVVVAVVEVVRGEDIEHLTKEGIGIVIVVEEEHIGVEEDAEVRESVGTEEAAVGSVGQLED